MVKCKIELAFSSLAIFFPRLANPATDTHVRTYHVTPPHAHRPIRPHPDTDVIYIKNK